MPSLPENSPRSWPTMSISIIVISQILDSKILARSYPLKIWHSSWKRVLFLAQLESFLLRKENSKGVKFEVRPQSTKEAMYVLKWLAYGNFRSMTGLKWLICHHHHHHRHHHQYHHYHHYLHVQHNYHFPHFSCQESPWRPAVLSFSCPVGR